MSAATSGSMWNRTRVFAAAILALALLVFWTSLLTGDLTDADAVQNLHEALNLYRVGVISDSRTSPFEPTMQREPLPVVMDALGIGIIERVMGPEADSAYYGGQRLKLLKLQNILWMMILSGAVFVGARRLRLPFWGALTCVTLTNLLLLDGEMRRYLLDSLCTEASAAALLLVASLLLAGSILDGGWVRTALSGVVFGLLTLVKASFLYIAPATAAVAVVLLLRRRSLARAVLPALLLCAGLAVTVFPWMYRNYEAFGVLKVAGRGGLMLYTRGIMDEQMTWDEYRGGYYFFAPYPVNGALRRLFGFSKQDVNRGGRVQRLNDFRGSDFAADDLAAAQTGRPQDAITYFLKGEAENTRLVRELSARGDRAPRYTADAQLQARGIKLILAHPGKELALTPLFLWRGAFFCFPALAVAFVWLMRRREERLALLLLPALGAVIFYGMVSFLIPRYSLPSAPVAILAAAALCAGLYGRRFRPQSGDPR